MCQHASKTVRRLCRQHTTENSKNVESTKLGQHWNEVSSPLLGLSAASFAQEDGRFKQPFTISPSRRDSDYDVSSGALAHPRPS